MLTGQHVAEEILDSQTSSCPPEYFFIDIPDGHEYREQTKHTKMPFIRAQYDHRTGTSPNNPRMQINHATPWIDAGFVYGTSNTITNNLREFKGGRLETSDSGKLPAKNDRRLPLSNPPPPTSHKVLPVDRLYSMYSSSPGYSCSETDRVGQLSQHLYAMPIPVLSAHSWPSLNNGLLHIFAGVGNKRGNESPFLLTFSIVWIRWHNLLADHIASKNSDWTDEQVFTEARKWLIATQQVYYHKNGIYFTE